MTGAEMIAAERQRQITEEGWTAEHDAGHTHAELARAAGCYAMPPSWRDLIIGLGVPAKWPWKASWWKPAPDDRVRELAKAGALIAAEIDRLLAGARPLAVQSSPADNPVDIHIRDGDLITIQWSGELRTVVMETRGAGLVLRDLTHAEEEALLRGEPQP